MLKSLSVDIAPISTATTRRPRNASLGKAWALVLKDVRVEMRRREAVANSFVFALIALVIFNIALDLERQRLEALGPGLLWVAFVFAGVLGLGRTFVGEKDRGSLGGILVAPVDRGAVYAARVVSSLLFLLVMEMAILPLFALLFNIPLLHPLILPVVLLGTLGFCAVGTLFSALVASARTREALLPVLLLPVVLPVVVGSVEATALVLQEKPVGELLPWLGLLAAFDAIFLAVGVLLFEFVLEGSDA
ncbi:MAG: cytochrome c-type biosis protein CcmB [Dehalococcoidia bacterium]|nr:cytochrome c-type biosis protein CcmB [Dehalococcoidia bacterium]